MLGTIESELFRTHVKRAHIAKIMYKRTIQEDMLDGIESNIEATERHICRLHLEFSTLGASGRRLERQLILQQLHVLDETLQLLKIRRVYASEVTLH
jgi:hypothetical protein